MHDAPFLFFFGAVVVSAWRGGLGPGMFSAALGIVTIDFFLIDPLFTVFTNFADLLQFGIFSLISLLVGWIEQNRKQSSSVIRELKDELDVILNTVTDGITAQDQFGNVVFANLSAAVLTGYTSVDSMINTPVEGLQRKFTMHDFNNEEIPFSALPRHHVFKTGKKASLTFKMCFTDLNEQKWIQIATAPVFGEDGQVKLAVNIFRDISDEIEAQQTLMRYRAIVQNSQDAIVGKSLTRHITSWNPGAERLYGYTAEEAIGQHISMLFPPHIQAQEMRLIDRIKAGEMIEHYETQRLCKDGTALDVSLTISPIRRNDNDAIIGYSTIERDITSRKMLDKLREDMQARVRKVLDNLTIFVAMLSPDGVILEANQSLLKLMDVSFDKIVGLPFEQLAIWSLSEENQTLLRATMMKAAKSETVRFDIKARATNGETVLFDFVAAPIFSDTGEVQYLIVSGVDITKRNQLTEELDAQRRQLSAIIQNVPGIIYDFSVDMRTEEQTVNFISDYIEKMLGYTTDEWRMNPYFWAEVVVEEDLKKALELATAAYEEKRSGNAEFRCIDKDGQIVNASSFFSFEAKGSQVRQYGVIMDVTERKKVEAQLANYMQELQQSNEELRQFAYVASHDLQEPLRMVTSYLQLIEKRYIDQLDDNAREFINFAVDGATRMKVLINDLLTYSRVQRSEESLSTVNMQEVINRVEHNLKLSIEEANATLTIDELPTVQAIPGQMVQLFQNLLSNAIKFRGDTAPIIEIGCKKSKTEWEFYVRDNGIGIEPQYKERIFVIFQRLHTRQDYEGTGIGLAICRKIVDKHQGNIWFESEPDKGTTFYFTIPLVPQRGVYYAGDRNSTS